MPRHMISLIYLYTYIIQDFHTILHYAVLYSNFIASGIFEIINHYYTYFGVRC